MVYTNLFGLQWPLTPSETSRGSCHLSLSTRPTVEPETSKSKLVPSCFCVVAALLLLSSSRRRRRHRLVVVVVLVAVVSSSSPGRCTRRRRRHCCCRRCRCSCCFWVYVFVFFGGGGRWVEEMINCLLCSRKRASYLVNFEKNKVRERSTTWTLSDGQKERYGHKNEPIILFFLYFLIVTTTRFR